MAVFRIEKTRDYTVMSNHHLRNTDWAVKDISFGKSIGWHNGYADGTFKSDNNINRAEVVTVVNHATGRKADENYIYKKSVRTQ